MAAAGGKPVTLKPGQGGKLMAGLSSETAGAPNYVRKEEIRRYLDREMRAEGHVAYQPNTFYDRLAQSIPISGGGPITLVSEVELGDGRVTLIAGNQTTLWRFFGLEDIAYFDIESGQAYFDTESGATYFDEAAKGWIQIGSGFSTAGARWEIVRIGDFVVLNNEVDLPITYRLDEYSVKPIYELREQQVASVKTICSMNDVLVCLGISQIGDDDFKGLMAAIPASLSASQDVSGKVSPAATTLFPTMQAVSLVGMSLFWSTGEQREIIGVDSNGFLLVNNTVPVSGVCSVENPAAYTMWAGKVQRYGWRVFPSMPSQPRRFGAIVTASMQAGSPVVAFDYPVRSLSDLFYTAARFGLSAVALPSIFLPQAAINAGNLISQVQWISRGSAMSMTMAEICQNTITSLPIEAADSQVSYAGIYSDLTDDGSAILRGMQLRDQLVIYKEPSPTPAVFIGTYTGAAAAPFTFQRVTLPNTAQALHYKNVIAPEGGGYYGSHHIYAGRNAFYKFDLFQLTPTEIPALTACQSLFFDNADRGTAFVSENHLTREIYFGYGIAGGALCYDYAQQTVRTTSAMLTAAAKVRHPKNGSDWYVMGMVDGSLKRYGLLDCKPRSSGAITGTTSGTATVTLAATTAFFSPDDVGTTVLFSGGSVAAIDAYISATSVSIIGLTAPVIAQQFTILPGIWHRDGLQYNSVIESGLDDFGAGNSEKSWNEYSLGASSKCPNAIVSIDFRGGSNPGTGADLQSGAIIAPQQFNNLRPTVISYYLGDRVTVTGFGPFEITSRMFNIQPINSHGFGNLPR